MELCFYSMNRPDLTTRSHIRLIADVIETEGYYAKLGNIKQIERKIKMMMPDPSGVDVEKEIIELVDETIVIESVQEITMTEALPTLWGCTQKLIEKIELLEKEIAELKSKAK